MSKEVRALRGATTVDSDDPSHITDRVRELVGALFDRNDLRTDDVISIFFTATPDIRSKFPASAARSYGLDDVPLIGAQELDVDGALPRCIRLMAHVNTARTRNEMRHVFLHDAKALRVDIAD